MNLSLAYSMLVIVALILAIPTEMDNRPLDIKFEAVDSCEVKFLFQVVPESIRIFCQAY